MNKDKKTGESKRKPGFDKKFTDASFIVALTGNPQTTAQIKRKIGCSHDTASRVLKRLTEDGMKIEHGRVSGVHIYPVEMMEIEAGTGTGKMNLWKLTEAGMNVRDFYKED